MINSLYGNRSILKFTFSISRQTSPVFADSLKVVPTQETQQMSMAMPYVEQFKFDEVLNRYNQRNGTSQK